MAVHRAAGTRDPYSYPHLENDDDFSGKKFFQVISFFYLLLSNLKFYHFNDSTNVYMNVLT